MRGSYTNSKSPLSLFVGLGSWWMCHASAAQRWYMLGWHLQLSQAISCVGGSSQVQPVQGSPFVRALLCSFIQSCNVQPVLCVSWSGL